MTGVFPDYPAPMVRNTGTGTTMRWGMPPPRTGGPPVTNIRNTSSSHWRGWLKPESRCLVPANSSAEYAPEPNPVTKNDCDAGRPDRAADRDGSRLSGSQREALVSGTRHKEARLV